MNLEESIMERRLLRRWAEWKSKLLPEKLGWTPNDIIKVVELRARGYNFDDIAKKIGKGAYYVRQIWLDMSHVIGEKDVVNCEVGHVYSITPDTLRSSDEWTSNEMVNGLYECIGIVEGKYTTHYIFRSVLGGSKISFHENEKGYIFREVT